MRALKTVQLTWIFVKNRAVHLDWQYRTHSYKMLWATQGIF